jgi:hypothetical protein
MSTQLGPRVYRITLNHALAMRLTGYALALFYLALGMVLAFAPGDFQVGELRTLVLGGVGVIAVCVGTVVVHELVHGVVFRLFGGTPRYGIGRIGWLGVYAYATAPGVPFTLMQMTVICLAPLAVISAITIAAGLVAPASAGFAAVAFVTNFSGAAGDVWMVVQMWRFRTCRHLQLVDMEQGLDIHTADPAASAIAARAATRHNAGYVHRILLRWLVTSTLLIGGSVVLSVPLSMVNAPALTLGPRQFAMASYSTGPGGAFYLTLDLAVIFGVALVCACVSVLFTTSLKGRVDDSATGSPHPVML